MDAAMPLNANAVVWRQVTPVILRSSRRSGLMLVPSVALPTRLCGFLRREPAIGVRESLILSCTSVFHHCVAVGVEQFVVPCLVRSDVCQARREFAFVQTRSRRSPISLRKLD